MLIKYLDLEFIIKKLQFVNRKVREIVLSENYILYKHFLRIFTLLNDRMKRSDIPGKVSIISLLRENMSLRQQSPANLLPYCFFTDSGTYNDDIKYFI